MTEKQKPAKSPKAWTGAKGMEHWGEIKGPPRYGDTLGKRIGNTLFGWLTAWKR
jgi:hypothetical protein